METSDRDLGCDHVENALAARDRHVFAPHRDIGLLKNGDFRSSGPTRTASSTSEIIFLRGLRLV